MKLSPALQFLSNHHWALTPMVFEALVGIIERHAAGDHNALGLLGDDDQKAEEPRMQILGSVAVIPVRGVLARYADQVNGVCQKQGRSAESLQADLSRAAKDPSVRQIVLRIDSPGGTVAGTAETADLVRTISASGKPVTAYVDGLAASAALWLAGQADEIVASSAAAEIGSIGVISAHVDVSRQAEARGAKVHIFRSVALKAPGAMGEALNADQLASIQRQMGELHQAFAGSIQAGRGLSDEQIAAVANGEVWTAERAIALGLADRIAPWDELLAELNGGPKARHTPTPKATAPAPASVPAPQTAPAAEGSDMMKILPAVALALAAAYPTDIEAVTADANAGHDEATIRANAETRKATKQNAVAIATATRERDEAKAAKVTADAALATEKTEHATTKAALAAAQTKLGVVPKHTDPGAGGEPTVAQIKRSDWEKNQAAYADALRLGKAVLIDG